jgi:hypothetical protein
LAGVLDEASGSVYVPWYPGSDPYEKDCSRVTGVKWSNEVSQSGDWVFACDPDVVFIEDPVNQPIYLLSNNNYTEDGRLVVTIWDAVTNEPIREVFYEDSCKKLARYAAELWRNTVSGSYTGTISPESVKDSTWVSGFVVGEFAVVKGGVQTLFSDPLSPSTEKRTLMGGTLIGIRPEVYIQTPKGRFYFVAQSPQGKGWLLEEVFELASINSLWKLGCLPCEGSPGPQGLC